RTSVVPYLNASRGRSGERAKTSASRLSRVRGAGPQELLEGRIGPQLPQLLRRSLAVEQGGDLVCGTLRALPRRVHERGLHPTIGEPYERGEDDRNQSRNDERQTPADGMSS